MACCRYLVEYKKSSPVGQPKRLWLFPGGSTTGVHQAGTISASSLVVPRWVIGCPTGALENDFGPQEPLSEIRPGSPIYSRGSQPGLLIPNQLLSRRPIWEKPAIREPGLYPNCTQNGRK
jgi:hypothetical protein